MPKNIINNHVFSIFDIDYTLKRYPDKHNHELRAWDAADTYLLNTLSPLLSGIKSLCIINDNFGALTVPLAALNPLCYGDSWMSRKATKLNCTSNHILTPLTFEENLDTLTHNHQPPDCVIGRVPKSTSQLIYIIKTLNTWLNDNTLLIFAGMDKHLSRGQYDQLEKYFGPSNYLPGLKKSRIWQARCNKKLIASMPEHSKVIIPEHTLTLTSHPNVFSRNKLDIGSRFFLNNLSRTPIREKVADMACGNGVLGLAYLRRHPNAHMVFCDESFQAVESTELNLRYNAPQATAHVYADDGLKQIEQGSLDLVLCNPPFHQQHTVSTDIAYSLFKDAYRALRVGGELWIVANRHLGYHIILKKIFGHCTTEVGHHKFCILRSLKSSSKSSIH